jgi:prepilin-type N-terminal cleavage/methylation domain-containing protein
MMFCRLRSKNKDQKGFTFVEILIAIAITGFAVSGIAMAISQMFNVHASASNRVTAIRQVQNAGFWVSQDAQQAQTVELSEGEPEENPVGTKFPLTLTWKDWDGAEHQVVYTLENMTGGPKQLKRSYYVDGGLVSETIVAEYIVPGLALTHLEFTDNKLILMITASVGGFGQASETRVYEIATRPSL